MLVLVASGTQVVSTQLCDASVFKQEENGRRSASKILFPQIWSFYQETKFFLQFTSRFPLVPYSLGLSCCYLWVEIDSGEGNPCQKLGKLVWIICLFTIYFSFQANFGGRGRSRFPVREALFQLSHWLWRAKAHGQSHESWLQDSWCWTFSKLLHFFRSASFSV
jgi:hypothetical protein